MPQPRWTRCPYCGRRYWLEDAPTLTDLEASGREDPVVSSNGRRRPMSWRWPACLTVVAVAASALIVVTHKNVVGVIAYAFLVVIGWRAWMRSRHTWR